MAFVKLDCGLLRSSLWVERNQRSLFVTALLMAVPVELKEGTPQLHVRRLDETGWLVPPGWYGLVAAAGIGIVRQDGMEREEGLDALEVLGAPDSESRSQDYEGRRLVRVDGGYLVLNYFKYRDYDHTGAERQRRMRARRKDKEGNALRNQVTRDETLPSHIAEADTEADALKTFRKAALNGKTPAQILAHIRSLAQERQVPGQGTLRYIAKPLVEELGPAILMAYEAIGGADRILKTPGEAWGFVVKEFTKELGACS